MRSALAVLTAAGLGLALISPAPPFSGEPDWAAKLRVEIERIDAETEGNLGVHVRRIRDETRLNYQADRPWYLASTTKVPVAIALLMKVQSGEIPLDREVELEREDFVDGSGEILRMQPGARLQAGYLLDRMLTQSDSTAADLLIHLIGVDELNRLVREKMVSEGFGAITSLLQVRKDAYSEIHPEAAGLSNMDFIELKKARGSKTRIEALRKKLGVEPGELRAGSLQEAFERYYERGLNSATLKAYGELLEKLSLGILLDRDNTRLMIRLMDRMVTGEQRIKAGLPPTVRFAQKTGTQLGRICNAGIMRTSNSPRDSVVVVACMEKFGSQAEAEKALKELGKAISTSGVLPAIVQYDEH